MPEDPANIFYAQTTPVTCPACGHGFDFAVWLIVDAAERPDLVQRIRAGALHDVTCPRCAAAIGGVDAPLLVYTPAAGGRGDPVPPRPAIIFSPSQGTTVEQDQQQAAGLVGLLRERLGGAWQDDWLAQGLPNLPREILPTALSDDPGAALREMAEGVQAELERLRQEDPEAFARLEEAAHAALAEDEESAEETEGPSPQEIPEEIRDLAAALESLPADQREALTELFARAGSAEAAEAALAERPDLQAALLQALARQAGDETTV